MRLRTVIGTALALALGSSASVARAADEQVQATEPITPLDCRALGGTVDVSTPDFWMCCFDGGTQCWVCTTGSKGPNCKCDSGCSSASQMGDRPGILEGPEGILENPKGGLIPSQPSTSPSHTPYEDSEEDDDAEKIDYITPAECVEDGGEASSKVGPSYVCTFPNDSDGKGGIKLFCDKEDDRCYSMGKPDKKSGPVPGFGGIGGPTSTSYGLIRPDKAIREPRYLRHRVDWCLHWGRDCGLPAANAFCQANQLGRAEGFRLEKDVGPTYVIGDRKVCPDPECDGFAAISCSEGLQGSRTTRDHRRTGGEATSPASTGSEERPQRVLSEEPIVLEKPKEADTPPASSRDSTRSSTTRDHRRSVEP